MRKYLKTYDLTKLKSIPQDVYEFCRDNNFSTGRKIDDSFTQESLIKFMLEECLDHAEGFLYLVHNTKKHLGWGLTYRHDKVLPSIVYPKFKSEFQCYVPPRNRRQGIGSMILKQATEDVGPVKVFNIDSSSEDQARED